MAKQKYEIEDGIPLSKKIMPPNHGSKGGHAKHADSEYPCIMEYVKLQRKMWHRTGGADVESEADFRERMVQKFDSGIGDIALRQYIDIADSLIHKEV